MKKAFFPSILILLVLTSQAFALYSIMDHFAAEAVLNKPEIVSNMDFLKHADNVVAKENTITYRSSFDNLLAVILTEVSEETGLNGLSVRLQMPVKENVTPHVYSMAKVRDATIDDIGEDFLESLGYEVEVVIDEGRDEKPVERPGYEVPVSDGGAVDIGLLPEPLDEEVSVIAVNDADTAVDAVAPVDVGILHTQITLLNKGNVSWSIAQYEDVYGSGVDFILNITDAETMSNAVREDFQKMLSFYGFDRNALNELDENMSVMRAVDLVPDSDMDRDKFDFKSAMKADLEWLKANGIIVGITEQDIAEISGISEAGMAGWNSRIIYSEGSWLPYYKSDDPNLIRILFEDTVDPGAVDTVEVPDGMVVLPAASVSPTGKYITKWGKIKSEL